MGRIEASFKAASKAVRDTRRGKLPTLRNPAILLTKDGFRFGEENCKSACALTENLDCQEDSNIADLYEYMDWLKTEYCNGDGKTSEDWDEAERLVQGGASFGLLLPWAKPPKRKPDAPKPPRKKTKANTPGALSSPRRGNACRPSGPR